MTKQLLQLICALVLACACANDDGPEPQLLSVEPNIGPSEHEVEIMIRGADFSPALYSNGSCGNESGDVDDAFTATLGGLELEQVTWIDETQLTAVVPAGLPPGIYDLTVIDPRDRTVTLQDAYEAVADE